MIKDPCYLCDCPGVGEKPKDDEWELDALKWVYDWPERRDYVAMKLCQRHKKYCENRIPELESAAPKEKQQYGPGPAMESLKKNTFVPKPLTKPERHFNEPRERNPGEDDD